jgi:uncharacterized protein YndB with AHSA1/START domain
MDSLTVSIDASPERVWEVLADFGNIYRWNPGVKHSQLTSDATSGSGVARHCSLPVGGLDEVVTAWEPQRRMAIEVVGTGPTPVSAAEVTFHLEPDGPRRTTVRLDLGYTPRMGSVGRWLTPVVDAQLGKGMRGLLAGLKEYAETGREGVHARDLPVSAVRVA